MSLIEIFPCPKSIREQVGWQGYNDAHNGHDIFGKNGDPLLRCVSGRIDPDRYGWNDAGGWRFWLIGSDGYRYYYAHCQEGSLPVPGSWGPAGEFAARMGQSGDTRGASPHLHLGKKGPDGSWIPDFYGELIEAYQRQFEIKKEVQEMGPEMGEPIGDGWWILGWFTKSAPWNCDAIITAKTSLTDIEVYWGDKRQGVYNIGRFNAGQTRSIPRENVPGDGMIWLRPVGGEILRASVRTYK